MSVFEHIEFDQHEQVSFFNDPITGLKAIIALHNTNLGPALGGCRMWDYVSDEDALTDVLRLSRGMTYKAAITNLPLGGGKSVIIGNSKTDKTPELMRAMGRCVEKMSDRYIIAEDVGTAVEDMKQISTQTKNVVGLPALNAQGGGDPSPITAMGVFKGLKAAARHRLNVKDLTGLTVIVQGLGHVGYTLCRYLTDAGAKIVVTDMLDSKIQQAVTEFGAEVVSLDGVYDVEADIFAPCALGGIINDDTLNRLKVKVIAGAANNQLAEARHGDVLKQRNVLYAPDYVINAGGLINVYYERMAQLDNTSYNRDIVMKHVDAIEQTTDMIFKRAEADNVATSVAADRIAEDRFQNGLEQEAKVA